MKSPLQQQKAIDKWNSKYPIGTAVTVTKDNGEVVTTKTRSVAWLLSSHTAVISVEGIAGGYLLERVKAVAP